jgi:hypothetical protein
MNNPVPAGELVPRESGVAQHAGVLSQVGAGRQTRGGSTPADQRPRTAAAAGMGRRGRGMTRQQPWRSRHASRGCLTTAFSSVASGDSMQLLAGCSPSCCTLWSRCGQAVVGAVLSCALADIKGVCIAEGNFDLCACRRLGASILSMSVPPGSA